MKRKQLLLSNYRYLLEYYNYDEQTALTQSPIIMLRLYDYTNNIANDMSILFITLDDLKEIIEHVKEGENISDLIVFPDEFKTNIFSKKFEDFNRSYADVSFYNEDEITADESYIDSLKELVTRNEDGSINIFNYSENFNKLYKDYLTGVDIYPIFSIDEDTENSNDTYKYYKINLKQIKMDHIRLYHPNNNIHENMFVVIDNYINNIHMIFLSKNITNMQTYSETEVVYDHQYYSEYIDIMFPNFKDLFSDDNFYLENLNPIKISDINNVYLTNNNLRYIGINEDEYIIAQYLSLSLMLKKYRLATSKVDDEIIHEKVFQKDYLGDKYYEPSIDINCYPFYSFDVNNEKKLNGVINDKLYRYALSRIIMPGYAVFNTTDIFSLQTYFGFDDANNHAPAIISKFNYPAKYGSTVEEAYCSYYNIQDKSIYNPENYNDVFGEELAKIINNNKQLETIKQKYDINGTATSNDIAWIKSQLSLIDDILFEYLKNELKEAGETYNIPNIIDIDFTDNKIPNSAFIILNQYYLNRVNFIKDTETYDIDDLDFIGYKILITSDLEGNNLLYSDYKSPQNVNETTIGINTFIFDINNIFNNWNNLPDNIFVSTIFTDRFTGVVLVSNVLNLTKEMYKYLINEDNLYKLTSTVDNWNSRVNILKKDTTMKIFDATSDTINFNFIDKINCVVNNNENTQTQVNIISSIDNKNIIYKPIFFKVNDLQNLRIRKGVEQNIGINLDAIYSKVNDIKLVIDGNVFYEIARYDSYCIFKVDASIISSNSGAYDIYSDKYISSGSWTLI